MYFDIGANIGRWSIANIHICDKIIAVEADPTTFGELKKNTANKNILCLNNVVTSQEDETITFYRCVNSDTLSTINKDWLTNDMSRFCGETYQEITCNTIKIDKLIELYGVPDLIKIDVEGGEYDCIQSLTQKVDTLCFEWASEVNDITFQCLDYLQGLGYTKFYVQYEDYYIFRPVLAQYKNIEEVKKELHVSIPKVHWGMMWCK